MGKSLIYGGRYKIFDKINPLDTSKRLTEKNVAVRIVIGSIFIGLGIAVGLIAENADPGKKGHLWMETN